MNESFKEDEIDLIGLIYRIFIIIKKRIVWLLVILVTAFIFGFFSTEYIEPIYQSNMVFKSRFLNDVEVSALISPIRTLVREGGYDDVSQKLGVSVSEVKNLKSIEVYTTDDLDENINLDENKNSPVTVNVQITDFNILKSLQKALLNYLQNHEYVKKRVEVDKNNKLILLEKLEYELSSLDTLKQKINQLLESGKINSMMLEPGKIFLQSVELKKEILEVKNELNFIEDIQLIQGFTKFSTPIKKSAYTNILTFMMIGLLLWVCLVVVLELRLAIAHWKKVHNVS